jgi:DNA-binding XRE family transcriptional regulator
MNTAKLKGKFAECGLTREEVAKILGINRSTLLRKLNGDKEFSRSEIQTLKDNLKLNEKEFLDIFFA